MRRPRAWDALQTQPAARARAHAFGLHRAADRAVVAAAAAHAVALFCGLTALATVKGTFTPLAYAGAAALIALGTCWGANTVAHVHMHTPLFRAHAANAAFALGLSVVLCVPQRLWTRQHLPHHGHAPPARGAAFWLEPLTAAAVWTAFALWAPQVALFAWLPGLCAGFALCWLQGRNEHAANPAGVDHHGRIHNVLWFNDGFHTAHHRAPAAHWTLLPALARATDTCSARPPLLREVPSRAALGWCVAGALDALERAALRVPFLRAALVHSHREAFAALLPADAAMNVRAVVVVGGGLFPRSVLALAPLLPHARFTIIDGCAAHAQQAEKALCAAGMSTRVHVRIERYVSGTPLPHTDLAVFPLAFRGARAGLYTAPPAPLTIVHAWLWARAGTRNRCVAWWLCKRMNLVEPHPSSARRLFPSRAHTTNVDPEIVPPWSPSRTPPTPSLPMSSSASAAAIGQLS